VEHWSCAISRPCRERVGIKGKDYDCDLVVEGKPLACDVKAKVESTELGTRTIEDAIEKAWHQLPAGGLSIVWVKLPQSWTESEDVLNLNIMTAMNAVRAWSDRIIAVVFHWEACAGLVVQVKYKVLSCSKTPAEEAIVHSLHAALRSRNGPDWVSLAQVVAELKPS
jgi:hypothetical protein